jgi:hypothetical protein
MGDSDLLTVVVVILLNRSVLVNISRIEHVYGVCLGEHLDVENDGSLCLGYPEKAELEPRLKGSKLGQTVPWQLGPA